MILNANRASLLLSQRWLIIGGGLVDIEHFLLAYFEGALLHFAFRFILTLKRLLKSCHLKFLLKSNVHDLLLQARNQVIPLEQFILERLDVIGVLLVLLFQYLFLLQVVLESLLVFNDLVLPGVPLLVGAKDAVDDLLPLPIAQGVHDHLDEVHCLVVLLELLKGCLH